MKLSAPTRYAIRIIHELSQANGQLTLGDISERTGISFKAVESTTVVLRNNGVTASSSGPKGGIELQKPLSEISLGLIIGLFDGGVEFAVCCGDKSNDCPQQNICETRQMWRGISSTIQKELDKISLQGLIRRNPELIVPRSKSG